jgi:hypothetical protein
MAGSWTFVRTVLCGVALALSGACSAKLPDAAVPEFPAEQRAIYWMLASELRDVSKETGEAKNSICIAVYRASDPDTSVTSPAVLEALRSKYPQLKLIAYSQLSCERNQLIFASDAHTNEPDSANWTAGLVCGGMCGWGHSYKVEIEGNEVRVEEMSEWIS